MSLRVLIIEDSELVRRWLQRTLAAEPDLEVVGTLESGSEPHADALLSRADVVLLDLLLPARSGLSLATQIASQRPVIVVSDADAHSPMITEALARGAGAYFTKRELGEPPGPKRLLDAIRALGSARGRFSSRVFVLVGSTGALGQHALALRSLHHTLASVVLLQHMPPERCDTLVDWVTAQGWRASFARHGDPLVPGRVLIAPADQHLVFTGRGRLGLHHAATVQGHRPSASLLIESGRRLGGDLVAVVFSGLGSDGAAGIGAVLNAGGEVLTIRPEQCAAPSMPRAAIEADARVQVLPLEALAEALPKMVGGRGAA